MRRRQVYYQCRACRHQAPLLAATLFEATKLSLTTWFLAVHLLTSNKTNQAALELKRHLWVCYRTTLLRAMVLCSPCAEARLRQASNFCSGGSTLITSSFDPHHQHENLDSGS